MGLNLRKIGRSLTDVIGQPFAPITGAFKANYDLGRAAIGQLTGNQQARNNALHAVQNDYNPTVQAARGFVTRPAAQIATTLGSPFHQTSFHPNSGIEKRIFGAEPVQNIQAGVVSTFKQHPNLPTPVRFGLAGAYGAGQVLNDLPLVTAAAKGAKVGIKTAGPVLKAADEIAFTPRASLTDRYTLTDMVDHLAHAKELKGEALSKTIAKTREIAQKHGLDPNIITNGTVPERMDAINTILDRVHQNIKSVKEGGYIGSKPQVTLKPEPKLPTTLPKAPSFVQKAFVSTRGELSKLGQGGAELSTRLQNWRNGSEVAQQAFLDSIPTVQKLHKEFPQFVDALDKLSRGEKPTMSPKVAQAVQEWSQNIPKVLNAAKTAGKEVGNRGQFYFPRQYSELLKTRNGFNSAVNHLVQTGQAKDTAEAIQQLQFMKSGKSFGNFKAREFDIPGFDKDQGALTKYIRGAFDEISKAEQFGPNGEVKNQLLAKIAQEGHDTGRAIKTLDIALGNVDKSGVGYNVSGKVRQFNSLRSLGTAGISNATQFPVNTGTMAGFGRVLKGGIKTLVSPEARTQAKQSGVLLDSAIDDLARQGLGTSGKITRNIAAPFFRQIEKFNRQATAIVGSDWGNSLAAKATKGSTKAETILREKLGVTGKIGSKLTKDQEIQAARGLVEKAQFKVDPQDLPGWVDSPLGKLVAQFRTFGYKQTSFMYNEVLREATKGNFAPLARFVAVAVPAGASAQYVKSKIKGTQYTAPNENKATAGLKAIAAVGGGGLVSDAAQNLYKSAQYGNLTGGLAGVIGGPTASYGVQTADNVGAAIQGKSKPLVKQAVATIPAIGPSIANRVFPKAATPTVANANGTPKEKNMAAKQEKINLETNAGNGYSLQQTSDGKYAYTLDGDTTVHTAKDLSSARQAIAEAGFKDETGSYKVIGDKVLRKGTDGKVTTVSKTKFDYQIGTATLTAQKNANNLKGWLQTAQNQLRSIDKQLKDPSIDPLEAITLQNQAETLQNNMEKYLSYGGFKKGSGGRTTIKPSDFRVSRGGVSIARPTITSKGTKNYRVAAKKTGGKPTVSLKKSLV